MYELIKQKGRMDTLRFPGADRYAPPAPALLQRTRKQNIIAWRYRRAHPTRPVTGIDSILDFNKYISDLCNILWRQRLQDDRSRVPSWILEMPPYAGTNATRTRPRTRPLTTPR